MPTWKLAQPFRVLTHNGEINTIRGNQNWMTCHEDRMASDVFGDSVEDLKPVVAKGSSDSAALDAVFELLGHGGRELPMVKTMMIPEAVDVSGDDELAKLYAYCNSVMEPWDGPAAIAAYANNWVIGGLDRNGLRPMRYVVTTDGLVIAGSETGMVVVPDTKIVERGRLGPGEMIGVNLATGEMLKDAALKQGMTSKRDWGKWVGRARQMESVLAENNLKAPERLPTTEARRRQLDGWLDHGRHGTDSAADG